MGLEKGMKEACATSKPGRFRSQSGLLVKNNKRQTTTNHIQRQTTNNNKEQTTTNHKQQQTENKKKNNDQ